MAPPRDPVARAELRRPPGKHPLLPNEGTRSTPRSTGASRRLGGTLSHALRRQVRCGGPASLPRRIFLRDNRLELPVIGIELRVVSNATRRCESKRWAVSRTICARPTRHHPRQPVATERHEPSVSVISTAISSSSAALQREQVAHSVLNRAAKEA